MYTYVYIYMFNRIVTTGARYTNTHPTYFPRPSCTIHTNANANPNIRTRGTRIHAKAPMRNAFVAVARCSKRLVALHVCHTPPTQSVHTETQTSM